LETARNLGRVAASSYSAKVLAKENSMTIKAIETEYGGYLFRSRLEARYAVFFDALNLEWEYEPEGYEIATGAWYLPDFFIPSFDCFIEIKGPAPNQKELDNARLLSSVKPVVIFHGMPGEHPGKVYLWDSTDSGGGDGWWPVWIAYALFNDGIADWFLVTFNSHSERIYLTTDTYKEVKIVTGTNNLFVPVDTHPLGVVAITAAKQARFEYGASHAR
jgi:hypothetical protein